MKAVCKHFGLSIRKSCELSQIPRSTFNYVPMPNNDDFIIAQIQAILEDNIKDGCEMVHMKLRQRNILINHKRTERIYKSEGLQLNRRPRRKKIAAARRIPARVPNVPRKLLAMDFVHDSIESGRKIKVLTVIDPSCNRSPMIHTDFSINGKKVVELLEQCCEENYYPEILKCDNGPEFRSKELDKWCFDKGIEIQFSRPGTPTDNCHIESFNGTFRNNCLGVNYFSSLKNARTLIDNWWNKYNCERPQKRLKGMTPIEYESKIIKADSN